MLVKMRPAMRESGRGYVSEDASRDARARTCATISNTVRSLEDYDKACWSGPDLQRS